MHPKVFEIPFLNLTVYSYGLMLVVGFLAAIYLIRRLSRNITSNPEHITNAALYSLIAGVVGARLFYVFHHFEQFKDNLFSVFAIWKGGLELVGGVILAITVIVLYMYYHKLPIRQYLDILAVALMLALVFGRIGCFLNGCCFGKLANLPWSVRFPYGSHAYRSQIYPNPERNRPRPQLQLPADFFGYQDDGGIWVQDLKPYELLTAEQKDMVTKGPYRCLPVHPAQLYSSANGLLCCLLLYLFWRRSQKCVKSQPPDILFTKPGCTFALMFILYGFTRFFLEFLRDDNPYEFDAITISQNIGIFMVVFGIVLMAVFERLKSEAISQKT